MRVLVVIITLLLAVPMAGADDGRGDSASEAEETKAAPTTKATTKTKATPATLFGGPRLRLAPPPASLTQEPRPVDLFPTTVFGPGTFRLDTGKRNEKGPGVRFGDGGWKTHVAQVGGMVAGWAALAALCGGSRCMLPKGLTSWMPGTSTEAPPAPARVGPRVKGMPKMR